MLHLRCCFLWSSACWSVLFAKPLMSIFIDPSETAIIAAGVTYLRIEGACYLGIGILFLLYGYYRAVNKPLMSVILTVASLGTRVALAYALAPLPAVGVIGIWARDPHRLGAGRRDRHRILRLSARRAQVGLERVHAAHGVIIAQIIQFSKLFHILFDTTDGRRL